MLTSIPHIDELEILCCGNCPMLTSIPNIIGLRHLDCCKCSNITSIPNIATIWCFECPWLNHSQNPDYENNIKKLLLLQRFYKKNFKYFVFKRWIKSKEFKEWFYSPENVGGRKHKRIMEKMYAQISD
jgi:hypothetical protein